MFDYPGSDLDRPGKLLSMLGSFWSAVYDGRELVRQHCQASGETQVQVWNDLFEAVRCAARSEVPVFHEREWYLIAIKESERGVYQPRYGDDRLLFGSSGLSFGEAYGSGLYAWMLPSGLRRLGGVVDRMGEPSLFWVEGLDYAIDTNRDLLLFREDPFAVEAFAKRPIYENGELVDREAYLWSFCGSFDRELIYRHWGYVLGVKAESSDGYRNLINAMFDVLAAGTALGDLYNFLAAATGIPLVKGVETVEEVVETVNHQVVITDQEVYRIHPGAEILVEPGDVLRRGQALCDGLAVYPLNRGGVPEPLRMISAGRGLMVGDFFSELTFHLDEVPLEVGSDADGYTTVRFELGGLEDDVDTFWEEVHRRGRESGTTLAHLLDDRTNREGEPGPSNLPVTVSPLEFLCSNVLRNGALLVHVKASLTDRNAPGLWCLKYLRKVVPPETLLIVLAETEFRGNTLGPEVVPAPTLASFDGAETIRELIGPGEVRPPRIRAWSLSGTCQ